MVCCPDMPCSADIKAIAYGLLVTLVLSCTMVVAGLKAGVTPGVSPLVVLCGWGAFGKLSRGAMGTRFLNLSQVAGSAGMAVVSGVIFAEPLLQVAHLNQAQDALDQKGVRAKLADMRWAEAKSLMAEYGLSVPEVDIPVNILACLVGSFIGWGFVGLTSKRFLSDASLPAPEARACVSMISAAVSDSDHRPKLGMSLVASILGSFLTRVMALMSLATSDVVLWSRSLGGASFQLSLPFDSGALYFGIGALLTVPTALLTFSGALVRLVGDYLLAGIDPNSRTAENFPGNSMKWVGGATMTVGVVYSLCKFGAAALPRRAKAGGGSTTADSATDGDGDSLLDIGRRNAQILAVSVGAGALALAVWVFVVEGFTSFSVLSILAITLMAMVMVPLGAMLSLQIGGSCSPVSGTVFVTTLVLCLVALVTGQRTIGALPTITTLLVAACVAVCSANDVSQDYKTLQLCGVAPREGFLAQILGLLVGSFVVPVSLYVSASAFGLGTSQLPAPQGQLFAALVQGLLIEDHVPWSPILVGLGLGVVAAAVDFLGGRAGLQLPAMALAVGIYLPPDTGVGILLGACFRLAGERLRSGAPSGKGQTHECILAAAGLITGGAFLDLLLGMSILFGFDPETVSFFTNSSEPGKISIPLALSDSISVLGLLLLGSVLLHNSWHGTGDAEGDACATCCEAQVGEPAECSATALGA